MVQTPSCPKALIFSFFPCPPSSLASLPLQEIETYTLGMRPDHLQVSHLLTLLLAEAISIWTPVTKTTIEVSRPNQVKLRLKHKAPHQILGPPNTRLSYPALVMLPTTTVHWYTQSCLMAFKECLMKLLQTRYNWLALSLAHSATVWCLLTSHTETYLIKCPYLTYLKQAKNVNQFSHTA